MRFGSTILLSALLLIVASPTFASPHPRRGPTSQRFSSKKSFPAKKPVAQRGIDPERVTQIQTALISRGYMTGAPTGEWTPETQDALRKLQADNGWPTRVVPDSRAIIKLGLGPGAPAQEGAVFSNSPASDPVGTVDADSPTPAQQ